MDNGLPLEVKVWGEFACFTRPEFGVERVSYEVMTPSAARGVLEAIFWKPEFRWLVREIEVLRPVRHFSILRNEMNSLQSDRSARGWEANGGGYYADDDRAQRHTLCLRDVAYVIRADIELKPYSTDNPAKYRDQFRRRVKRGQCFNQPYLGTREFSAFFCPPDGGEQAIGVTDDLGLMLFDVDFEPDEKGRVSYAEHGPEGRTIVRANARPKFFRARLEGGVMKVPREMYEGGRA
ncbi:MAG: type I-C CRISPR-associated protein Cas5 [Rubrobacter sp.]|nr:type I-C CRISPR-associated protein Cas5 [Rubrobacter sp.]MBA3791661.1 type I-C CRISPR-associated protein Cas5 [Rubrobacter sp.]